MSCSLFSTPHHGLTAASLSTAREPNPAVRFVERATWAFVGLGVMLRIARYAMDFPLWWDEAFVAVNFIRRDYLDLLRPLDYGQVCPVLFLWAELTVVKLLGFSEWSLRLFPLVCAIVSVGLFRHVAGRVVRGIPLLLAMAIFAASFHPIRHAADVKPYASDLLAALGLLASAFEWLRNRDRAGWMWALAVLAPIAIALSHPSIFVAGGLVLGLAPAVVKAGRRHVGIAYATFALSTAGVFLALYTAFTRAQAAATLTIMQAQWGAAFPPRDDPMALVRWLATVHTSSMFAYPCGGERGASSLTLLSFVVGVAVLWCRGHRTIVLAGLAPFGMALAAAALRRYPYGGVADGSPARVMQYLVPSICLFAGLGASAFLGRILDPRLRLRALRRSGVPRRDRCYSPGCQRIPPVPSRSRPAGSAVRTPILARLRPRCRAGLPALGPRPGRLELDEPERRRVSLQPDDLLSATQATSRTPMGVGLREPAAALRAAALRSGGAPRRRLAPRHGTGLSLARPPERRRRHGCAWGESAHRTVHRLRVRADRVNIRPF